MAIPPSESELEACVAIVIVEMMKLHNLKCQDLQDLSLTKLYSVNATNGVQFRIQ